MSILLIPLTSFFSSPTIHKTHKQNDLLKQPEQTRSQMGRLQLPPILPRTQTLRPHTHKALVLMPFSVVPRFNTHNNINNDRVRHRISYISPPAAVKARRVVLVLPPLHVLIPMNDIQGPILYPCPNA